MQLFNVLKSDELADVRKMLDQASWQEMQNEGSSSLPKNSYQEVTFEDAKIIPIFKILDRIFTTTIVKNFVFCKEILSVRCQKFRVGEGKPRQSESSHVRNYKCDLSWILCISDEESYSGGDITIQSGGFKRTANLQSGTLVIYKTGSYIEMSPVVEGEKLLIQGGIESFIPSYDGRETLYKLSEINEALRRSIDESGYTIEKKHADVMNQAWHQMVRLLSTREE